MGVHKKILKEEERTIYLDRFNKIIELFDNNSLSNDEKVRAFLDIYSTVKKFETDYKYFFDKCGIYGNFSLDKIKLEELYKKVLMFDKEGMISNLKYIMKIENLINNYDYAEYIINAYITMDNSYIPNFFYKDLDIDENIFNYCIKIIKEINPMLYHKYEERRLENIRKRYDDRVRELKEIATGIKTGKLTDGTKFDILQFWKLVPFKYFHGLQMELLEYKKNINSEISSIPDSVFYRNIRNFVDVVLNEESDVILGYMRKNNINSFRYISLNEVIEVHETTISQKKVLPNGDAVEFQFDKDDINKIFKYMNYYKLPRLIQVYNVLRERYLNGDDLNVPEFDEKDEYVPLILDEVKEQQKENIKILIKK